MGHWLLTTQQAERGRARSRGPRGLPDARRLREAGAHPCAGGRGHLSGRPTPSMTATGAGSGSHSDGTHRRQKRHRGVGLLRFLRAGDPVRTPCPRFAHGKGRRPGAGLEPNADRHGAFWFEANVIYELLQII